MFNRGLQRLDEALDALALEDVAEADDAELGEHLVEMRRRVDRLDAEWQRRFAVFERRAGWRETARTAAAWLRRHVQLAAGEARMRALAVRRLPLLPATDAAYERGDVSFAHVSTIVRAVTDLRAEHVEAADQVFAEAARNLAPADLLKVVTLWRDTVDPEAGIKELKSAHERRKLWAAKVGDVIEGGFRLDPVDGEAVLTALHAYVEAGRKKDDPRTLEQRRADALVELCEAALRAGETPLVGGERPHVAVTTPAEVLGRDVGGSAQLEWGGLVPGEVARMLACDARVCRIVVNPNGVPVSASAPSRTVPAWLRRLLVARDQGCRMPDCDREPGWCVAHHIRFWGQDGPTELDNLVLLCRSCHKDVHLGGWSVRLEADGTVVATSPKGLDYHDPPPGRTEPVLVASETRATYRPGPPGPSRPRRARRRTGGVSTDRPYSRSADKPPHTAPLGTSSRARSSPVLGRRPQVEVGADHPPDAEQP